jgi:hypothetical protein
MPGHRFGLKALSNKGTHSIGLKSQFGLKPKIPVVQEPVATAGFLYTIDDRSSEGERKFYFLEYNSGSGKLIRESLITNLNQYAGISYMLLVADKNSLFILDTSWWAVHRFNRKTLGYTESLPLSSTFNYPGWPYECFMGNPLMFTGDEKSLYIFGQGGGRDETSEGNNSSWNSYVMKIRKSDLVIQAFADAVISPYSVTPTETAAAPGDYLVLKSSSNGLSKYLKTDLSFVDTHPDFNYQIYCVSADSIDIFIHSYGHMSRVDPATWEVLLEAESEVFANVPSIAVNDTEFLYIKTNSALRRYKKSSLSFQKTLNSEISSRTMRLAIVNL